MQRLHLNAIKFSYGKKEKIFIYNFVLSLDRPIAVRGESGVGKTTLLDLIAGFLKPHEGKIYGEDEYGTMPLTSLSYLRQNAPLFDLLTVQKNLFFSRASPEKIYEISEELGISNVLMKRAGDLSGGQRQRVLLAQTVLQNRSIILLDEPFQGLDQKNKEKAIQVINTVLESRERQIIFTTHDPHDTQSLGACEVLL